MDFDQAIVIPLKGDFLYEGMMGFEGQYYNFVLKGHFGRYTMLKG
jgi:hypothetical protein